MQLILKYKNKRIYVSSQVRPELRSLNPDSPLRHFLCVCVYG